MLQTISIIVALACLSQAQDPPPFYRFDYKYSNSFEAYYKVYQPENFGYSHSGAAEKCLADGSQLWAPETEFELFSVYRDFVNRTASQWVWLGFYRFGVSNKFYSVSGVDVEKLDIGFSLESSSNCVHGNDYRIFNDKACDTELPFICKKSVKELSANEKCKNHDPEYIWSEVTSSCYKFHTTEINWFDAVNICRAENAHLAILNSENEAEVMVTEFEKYPYESIQERSQKEMIFLGFSNHLVPNSYVTLTGQTMIKAGFAKWADEEPLFGTGRCGTMGRNGTLHSVVCSVKAMFVCEIEIV